jgi:hypothetical protein
VAGISPLVTEGSEGASYSEPPLWKMYLDDVPAPVILPDCPGFVNALRQCILGWPYRLVPFELDAAATEPPLCVIEPRGPGQFRAHSRYLDEPLDDLFLATAICVVLADLSQAYADQCSDHVFGLHCGGVSIGTRCIILAGERRAGKSTLVARLSAEPGVEVFSDDVLPVTADGSVIGLGLAPRLRLPLPDGASPQFEAYVRQHLGPSDDRYGYLLTPALAPHDRRAKGDAFVLLDRRPGAHAALHVLPADEMLRALIERSIAGPVGPAAIFDAARALSLGLRGFRLVYSDLDEAADLLLAAFRAHANTLAKSVPLFPQVPQGPQVSASQTATRLAPSVRCRRARGAVTRRIGDAAFLFRPADAMLWHLNPTAQAVWALLARPATARRIARQLGELFPDEPEKRLLDDTRSLLARLEEEGFIAVDSRRSAKAAAHKATSEAIPAA